jgi:mRNA-degrading endonuclease HigB of HigAB toxin-antitoxin module
MMHKATEKFWNSFENLPSDVQVLAKKNFSLLKENSRHPSLHFKRLGKFWSVRIGLNHRALAILHQDIFYWHWIGTHAEYDFLTSKRD